MRLLLAILPLLAACASLPPADPATMDCAALTQALAQTRQQLQDERQAPRSPVQLNIGLGGAIGSSVGGLLLATGGFPALGTLTLACTLLSAVFLVPARR